MVGQNDLILMINLFCSTLIFYMAARIYVLPRLSTFAPKQVLIPILLLHSFRHLGLMFLSKGATYPDIHPDFAYPAAYGDALAATLAFFALLAVITGNKSAQALIWAFNIVGIVDLVIAIVLATIHHMAAAMGPSYWIPAFWVPALLVTHYITFRILLLRRSRSLVG
jgi:hypothetical protein